MFEYGQKLELKKDFTGDISIDGIFPAGDGTYKEKNYKLTVNGFSRVLPAYLVESLFKTLGEVVESEPIPEIKINEEWEKTDLIKEAKELGIKSPHLMKEDTLIVKIEEAKNNNGSKDYN